MKKYTISFPGLQETWRNPKLSLAAKVILFDIILYAGTNGESFPSQKTLAKNHGISSRYVRDLLRELKQENKLSWVRGGFSGSNKYTPNEELYCLNDKLERKYAPANIDIRIPLENGTVLPTKELNENNKDKISNSTTLQKLFLQVAKHCTNSDLKRLHDLCGKYSQPLVEKAIRVAGEKTYPFIRVGIIEKILEDFENDGVPQEKPKFVPCGLNGCTDGYFFKQETNTYQECSCRLRYLKNYNEGGTF